jgi:hypothetical protein
VVHSDVGLLRAAWKKFQFFYQVLGIASVIKTIIKTFNDAFQNSRAMLRIIFLSQTVNNLKASNNLCNQSVKEQTWPGTTIGFNFASGSSR